MQYIHFMKDISNFALLQAEKLNPLHKKVWLLYDRPFILQFLFNTDMQWIVQNKNM